MWLICHLPARLCSLAQWTPDVVAAAAVAAAAAAAAASTADHW